jgi:hypothetical protein
VKLFKVRLDCEKPLATLSCGIFRSQLCSCVHILFLSHESHPEEVKSISFSLLNGIPRINGRGRKTRGVNFNKAHDALCYVMCVFVCTKPRLETFFQVLCPNPPPAEPTGLRS